MIGNQDSERSKKVSFENTYDALDEIDQVLESWNDRLTLESLAIPKDYVENRINIYALWRVSGDKRQDYYAVFQNKFFCGKERNKNFRFHLPRNWGDGNRAGDNERASCDENGMFVIDVNLVKLANGLSLPSRIGLQAANKSLGCGRKSLYFSRSLGFKTLPICRCWEVCIPQRAAAGSTGRSGQVGGYQIEGGSQVMSDIADDGRKLSGNLLNISDARSHPIMTALSNVILKDNAVRFVLHEPRDFSFEFLGVAFGPLNL